MKPAIRSSSVGALCLLFFLVSMAISGPVAHAASFNNVAPMNAARTFHTATLLPGGKVLVAGGSFDGINVFRSYFSRS